MNALRLGGLAGLLWVVGILTGCSLFSSNDEVVQNDLALMDSSSWLIAAQGQGGPPNCVKDLAPGQAKKLAEKALKDRQEIQLLKQALERRGKKLVLSRAHGCKVKNKASSQGLSAQQETTTEATLVEVPAGSDAALYLLEKETVEEGNYWASLREPGDGGETLVHLEVGLGSDTGVQGLSTEPGEAKLFLPDDLGTQEVASDLEQLLAESATTSAGLRALQMDALDWANAEVVVDKTSVIVQADGAEEMEALVVVPPVDSATQQLWGRTRPLIDVERATHVKVTVRRTPPSPSNPRPKLQVVRPTPERPVVQPVVKKGIDLKPAFQYCPYPYYGKLSSFQKVLCQDSWQQWYKKQWDKKLVYERILRATKAVAQDAYDVTYAWDRKRGIDLIAAGFKGLSLSQLQTMLDLAVAKVQDTQPQLPTEILQRWEQASSLINTITPAEFGGWFDALSQATEQGRFDEEYSRLLSQGLERLQNALLILMNSQDAQRAKDLLYKAAQVWARLAQISSEVSEEIKQRMRDVQVRLESNFLLLIAACDLVPFICSALPIAGIDDPLSLIQRLIGNWDTMIRVGHSEKLSDQDLLKFSIALHVIVASFAIHFDLFIPTPSNIARLIEVVIYTKDLANFLDWMTSPYIQDRTVRDRLEQGFGTIVAAGNSVLQGGWEYKGLRLDQDGSYTQQGLGDWWGAVLLLPKEKNPMGRSIVAVSRGDHCVDCGTKADEISRWVGRAVELAPSVQKDNNADLGVVTFAFTNPNADVASVLQRLKQDHQNSNIPVIVAWIENGQVRYECISQGCSNLSWQEQERIACNQLGLAAGCAGPPQEPQTSTTSPPPAGTPITVGSPPPPDPSSFCQGKICII